MILIKKIKAALLNISDDSPILIRVSAKSAFVILRSIKRSVLFPQKFYEIYLAKWIAKYLFILYLPLEWLLKCFKVRLVSNIANGVGHIIIEFDRFFRLIEMGKISKDDRYFLIMKRTELTKAFVSIYGGRFHFACANTLIYDLFLPLLMHYPRFIDVGLSRMKWQIKGIDKVHLQLAKGYPFCYQVNLSEGLKQWRDYYTLRLESSNFHPLSRFSSKLSYDFLEALGVKEKKFCIIHFKNSAMNATALPTDPKTYLPAMSRIKELGYSIVFAGREIMPPVFKEYGSINYAESKYASFENDIALFQKGEFSILGGSGIVFLADCYDKPYLYLNTWHLGLSLPSKKCICVPTLVQEKGKGLLSFSKQIELFFSSEGIADVFPFSTHQARNASADEIDEALLELFSLMKKDKPCTNLQKKYNQLDEGRSVLSVSQSRASQYFLEKNKDLF